MSQDLTDRCDNQDVQCDNRDVKMKKDLHSYVVSFQAEPFRQGTRHHWLICREHQPNELVSWGHAPTLELAQAAAQKEVQDLSSGQSQGGQAVCTFKDSPSWILRRKH